MHMRILSVFFFGVTTIGAHHTVASVITINLTQTLAYHSMQMGLSVEY